MSAGERPLSAAAPARFAMRSAPLAALCAGALSACTPGYDACFDPPAMIRSAQVLAVRADPPESIYQPGDPAPVVRLRALVAMPDARTADVLVRVRLCPDNPFSTCSASLAPAASLSTDTDHVDLDGVVVPPEVIAQALASDPLHGYGGVRVLADLSLEGALDSVLSLHASKVLLFSPHGAVPNQPIELDGLQIASPVLAPQLLPQGRDTTAFLPDPLLTPEQQPGPLWLTPVLRPGSLEEYDTKDLAGRPVHLLDGVTYHFHANIHLYFGDPTRFDLNGGFTGWQQLEGGDVATEPPAGTPAPPHGLARLWALAPNTLGRVWVVARDTRGAEAWTYIYVSIQDNRPGGGPLLQEPLCDWSDSVIARRN